MKITELSVQKKNASRFNLYVDEQFFCGISTTGVAKYNLYKGKEIDASTLDEIVLQEIYQRFLDRGSEYLSRAIKSERDTRRYLKQLQFKKKGKWFDENLQIAWDELFERVISQLRRYKFLDDSRFAQLFVENRARNRPRSSSVIVSELMSKGIGRSVALEAVSKSEISDEQLILKVYIKKFKNAPLALDDRKKVDFLRRKGFNWDEISKLADDLKHDSTQ